MPISTLGRDTLLLFSKYIEDNEAFVKVSFICDKRFAECERMFHIISENVNIRIWDTWTRAIDPYSKSREWHASLAPKVDCIYLLRLLNKIEFADYMIKKSASSTLMEQSIIC